MQNLVVNYETDPRTPFGRLNETFGNPREEVIAESAHRSEVTRMLAAAYDASNYAWRSDGRVGNTITEIEEIRAYGFPLDKSDRMGIGDMYFRGYQYEDGQGFLKGSKAWDKKPPIEESDYDEIDYLYAEPLPEQEKYLITKGYEEVVHNVHGRGFLLDRSDDLSKVYFMHLPGSTPSCHHGANIRWVKRSNLL